MHTPARTHKPRRRTLPPAKSPTPTAAPTPNPPFRGDPSEAGREAHLPSAEGGKAVAARNATTHGLFARDVVLPALGEDPAAFDVLLTQLCAQLPPRNLLERHYLEQIAAASWRLRRLHRWQAQIYEDGTLTEDQRLDRLDKVLRHEIALTRQIDRAIRALGRDLKSLFEDRARADALYSMDICESECKADLYRELDVQRRTGQQVRSQSADAALDYATLDTQAMLAMPSDSPTSGDDQKCKNEIRQNDPPPREAATALCPWPLSLSERGGVPDEGGVGATAAVNLDHSPTQAPLPSEGRGRRRLAGGGGEDYIAYRKWEQAMFNKYHPDKPDITDWNDPDLQDLYAKR